jgi:integral membrane sensor domain MASE1
MGDILSKIHAWRFQSEHPNSAEYRPSLSCPKYLLVVLGLAILYVVTARLGLTLALPPEGKATAVWTPSGIALAGVLLKGRLVWPGIWLGAFLGNFWDYFISTDDFSLATHLMVSGGIATGSTLQALLGAYLLQRWIGWRNPLGQARTVFQFVTLTLFICLVASTIGVTTMALAGFASWPNYGFNWLTWWIGDTAGIFIVTPLILAWSEPPQFAWQLERLAEAGLLLGLVVIVALWVFSGWQPWGIDTRLMAYMTVPPLVWASFRFGQHGATAALLLLTGIAVWGTAQDQGPFVGRTLNESLILLQAFISVLTVTALALAGMVSEGGRAERVQASLAEED